MQILIRFFKVGFFLRSCASTYFLEGIHGSKPPFKNGDLGGLKNLDFPLFSPYMIYYFRKEKNFISVPN
ncbi:MAG: hypothetical protein RR676_09350, partial [Acinetobacter sp.]